MRIGSDTGGTFTDLVDDRGRVAKVLSTPEDPTEAVRAGIAPYTDDSDTDRLVAAVSAVVKQ